MAVETSGGAHIGGDASAGRDLVGRDQYNYNVILDDHVAEVITESRALTIDPVQLTLIDREPQQDAFLTAVKQRSESGNNTPIVFVLHGCENESHGAFVERLVGHELVQYPLGGSQNTPLRLVLEWSPQQNKDLSILRQKVCQRLSRQLHSILNDSARSPSQGWLRGNNDPNYVNELIVRLDAPIVLESRLQVKSWPGNAEDTVRMFLDFWSQWPPLAENQWIICILCLCYPQRPRRWFFWGKTAEEIADLAESNLPKIYHDLRTKSKLIYVVLPALSPVLEGDVHKWQRNRNLSKGIRLNPNLDLRITTIYRSAKRDRIPMLTLRRRLSEPLS